MLRPTSLAALTALLTLGTSAPSRPTFAAPTPRDEARGPQDIRARQSAVRSALASFGVDLGGDRLSFGRDGREDLVMFTSVARESVLASLKAAYGQERILPGGLRIAGWAHIGATDTHTFTVRFERGGSTVIEVGAELGGTRIVVWGLGRGLPPDRRPVSALPIRLVDPDGAPLAPPASPSQPAPGR